MRTHDKMTRRNVYLPDVLYARFVKYANANGVGAAEIMRTALAEYIERKDVKRD